MANGYCFVCVNGKTVRRNRYVMEKHLGRKLTSNEVVHHKDGIKTNDNISNLQVMTVFEHNRESGQRTLTGAHLQIEDVLIIRKMLRDGIKKSLIAFAYGVVWDTIASINRGDTWAWI